MIPTDTAALDRLVASTWDCAARSALMEAHRLLCMLQYHEAADALLEYADSVVARSRTFLESEQAIAIAKAKEG